MAATTALVIAQGIGALAQAAGSIQQSRAIREQGNFEKRAADANARFSRLQAEDARRRGETASQRRFRERLQQVGTQRARGAQASTIEETRLIGAVDIQTIRNNAAREAFGFQAQANEFAFQGQLAQIGARNRAVQTLATGGVQFGRNLFGISGTLVNAQNVDVSPFDQALSEGRLPTLGEQSSSSSFRFRG